MANSPISLITPQYVNGVTGLPFSGSVLKAYRTGSLTNITMSTDSAGGTTFTSVALNSSGYPEHQGAIIIPHIAEDYKLALYPTQAAADADSSGVWVIDTLKYQTGITGDFLVNDSTANGPTNVITLTHTTSGTPAVGIGTSMAFVTETANDNNETGMLLQAITTDVTSASEDFDFIVKLMKAGAVATEVFRVSSTGKMTIQDDVLFSVDNPEILGGDTNGVLITGPSTTNILGSVIFQYGDTHATKAKDFEIYADAALVLQYDFSATIFDFQGNAITTTGAITTTDAITATGVGTFGSMVLTTDLPVIHGGTGASTFTDGAVLLGSGSSTFTALDVSTKGSILVGDGTTDPIALAVGSNTQILVADSTETSGLKWQAPSTLPFNSFGGLGTSIGTDTDHDIDIVAGQCADSTNAVTLALSSTVVKRIDASWVTGTGNGGLSSSLTVANNTWYHLFIVKVGGVDDVLFDTSVTCANGVSDHTVTNFQWIGAVLTNGSANIIAYLQIEDVFWWDVPVRDASTANPGTSVNTVTLSTPLGIQTEANVIFSLQNGDSTNEIIITNSDQTDTAPLINGVATTRFLHAGSNTSTSILDIRHYTNTSSQLRYRVRISNSSLIVSTYTTGWRCVRGTK